MAAPSERGRRWRRGEAERKLGRTTEWLNKRYRYTHFWLLNGGSFKWEFNPGLGKPRETLRINGHSYRLYLRLRAKQYRDTPKRSSDEIDKSPRYSAYYKGKKKLTLGERRSTTLREALGELAS